ncbi:copper resistance protein B [Caulobacter segnis]|uniref:Copper resistance B n=2 Tax=Caulobacter segnis TaxID=88688 RepID=D5VKF0_CAUST|nr:copper resistance protein B [Caulobacter segnis]ADG10973.1 copper resistance B precursor [Caulobacter segnis ATCC 21756]AVQ02668.1 copper resistance protein B [Caulobacter segnis]
MKASLIALLPALWSAPALAQHAGHASTPVPASPSAKPVATSPAPAADPHAGHDMSAMPGMAMPPPSQPQATPADPHAGHDMGAMPDMSASGSAEGAAEAMGPPPLPDHETAPPAAPTDHLADKLFDPLAMDRARAQLRKEHGGAQASKVMANLLEYQARSGGDGYHWDGEAWFGGDLNRLVLKSEGEGDRHGVEAGEVQALYSRAVGLYTDLQVGVRQDVEPKSRTYATVGFETLLPYWIEAGGALFLSDKGDLLGRAEGAIDWRVTQRLILQPRAELNFAAQNVPETATGSGLSDGELGLRLRYEVRREFAPYVGLTWSRRFGRTADYARAAGRDVSDTSVVVGLRAWF